MAMTALEYLNQLRPAIPMSLETSVPKEASNGVLRDWMKRGLIHVNYEPLQLDDRIDFVVYSLIFFPRSKRRTTLV